MLSASFWGGQPTTPLAFLFALKSLDIYFVHRLCLFEHPPAAPKFEDGWVVVGLWLGWSTDCCRRVRRERYAVWTPGGEGYCLVRRASVNRYGG